MKRRVNANPFLLIFVGVLIIGLGWLRYELHDYQRWYGYMTELDIQNGTLADTEIKRNFRLIHELQDAQKDNRRLTKALDRATNQEMPTQEFEQ